MFSPPSRVTTLSRGLLVTTIALIQGCSSTDKVTPPQPTLERGLGLPADAKLISNHNSAEGREMFRDMQLALKSRNLYQTMGGDISYIKGQCPIDVIAHRGSSNYAENSRNAIQMAAVSGFDGAEIDVMLTRDKDWVVHHDIGTGRATARSDGKRYRVSRMKSSEWNSLSGRSPDGTLDGYRPAYFNEAVNDWYHYATIEQPLNIEIKTSDGSMEDLFKLDEMARQSLPYRNYFYSSMDMDVLKKMREINSSVYLGYVWEPHSASVAQFKRDAKRGMGSDDYYQKNKKNIDRAFAMEGRYRKHKPKHSAKTVKRILGSNSGLHVDIRSYRQYATIYSRAKAQGMKVVTYTINGTDYHQDQLVSLAKAGRPLPDEAIMDTSKFSICQQLAPQLVVQSNGYQPTTLAGETVAGLPNDADFHRLYEQIDYLKDGHYITNRGLIRSVSYSKPANVKGVKKRTQTTQSAKPAVLFDIQDEDLNLSNDAISISMPTEK
ncbi:glycerophosphodiester phosphodiesterase [Vibrio sp. F13]|uniref:glycerophosphodiester phosphodiesterase n=1 Tax=unclassified Vibrio TaxID=2614977 RepID=UPI0010BD8B07|nr:glycerophosphodiester phosphodiesterase [Vibrio sp. F13]TKF92133.1 glycerophosphodiester phosphodiesterase [Vibrio sp. F13]